MAEDRIAHGIVTTSVTLGKTDSGLEWGKWDDNYPLTSIPPNTDGVKVFVARGRKGDATGTSGFVKYQADDGTVFGLSFDVPYSKSNSGGISAEGAVNAYSYTIEYPQSGNDVTFRYTIQKNAQPAPAIDAGTLLDLPKCSDYGQERVEALIGGRATLTLLDILDTDFEPRGKLWCIFELGLLPADAARQVAFQVAERLQRGTGPEVRALTDAVRGWMAGDTAENEVRRRAEPLHGRRSEPGVDAALALYTRDGMDALRDTAGIARAAAGDGGWEAEALWQIERVKEALRR